MSPVNRYDTPAQANFINTYSPVPFDALLKIGMLKQARIEQGQEDYNKTSAALNAFATAPADEPAYREKMRGFMTKLEEGIQSGVGSQDQMNSLSKVRNEMLNDEDMRKFAFNKKVWDKNEEAYEAAMKDNALPSNMSEILNVRRDLGSGGDGSKKGMYNVGGWSKNVETYKAQEQYVNDVDASSFEKEGTTGKWILNTKGGGRTMQALGAPLGISFEQVPGKGGKGVVYNSVINDPAMFRYNLLNKPEGRQYINNAKYTLGKNTVDEEVMQLATAEAKSEMVKAVQERVSSNSSETIQIDPEWMANYNDKLKNFKQSLSWDSNGILKGSEIENQSGLETAISAAGSVVTEAQQNYDKLKAGLRAVPITNDKGKVTGYEYWDTDAKDHTDEMRQKEAALDAAQKEQENLGGIMQQVRKETAYKLKVGLDYEPPIELKKKAFRRALTRGPGLVGAALEAAMTSFEVAGGDYLAMADLGKDVRAVLDKNYNRELEAIDPFTREVNRNLAERHKDKIVQTRLTNFTDDRSNKLMEEGFLNYASPNAAGTVDGGTLALTNVKTGELYGPSDYKKLSNGEPPKYLGWDINPNSGEVQVHYRPYSNKSTKDKMVFLDEVTTKPPAGFINMLINEGQTNNAELYIANQLSDKNLATNETISIPLKDRNGKTHDFKVTKISETQRKLRGLPIDQVYMYEYDETSAALHGGVNTTVKMQSKNTLIYDIMDYANKLNLPEGQ